MPVYGANECRFKFIVTGLRVNENEVGEDEINEGEVDEDGFEDDLEGSHADSELLTDSD